MIRAMPSQCWCGFHLIALAPEPSRLRPRRGGGDGSRRPDALPPDLPPQSCLHSTNTSTIVAVTFEETVAYRRACRAVCGCRTIRRYAVIHRPEQVVDGTVVHVSYSWAIA